MDIFKRHIQDHNAPGGREPHWGYATRVVPCTNDPGSCAYLDAVYEAHDVGMVYMGILWATIFGILFVWWFARLAFRPAISPAPKQIPSALHRVKATAAAACRRWLLPDANHFVFCRTTRLQVTVLAALCGYLTLWTFVGIAYGTWVTPIKNSKLFNTRTSLGPWSDRIGVVAYALTPLSIMLSSRESLLSVMTGLPYQTFMFLHRWVGYVIVIQASMHTIGWCVVEIRLYQPQPKVSLEWIAQQYIIWGVIAMFLLVVMLLLSTPWGIRLTGYEFFRKSHYVLAMIYIGACWAHWSLLECFLVPAFILWGIDRGARFFRTLLLHYQPGSVSGTGFAPAQARITSYPDAEHGDIIRLDVENPQDTWEIGQHFYLCFPESSMWQSHPFTPLNAPVVKDGVVKHSYIMRAKGGETKRIAQLAEKKLHRSGSTTTPVIFTGPYGDKLMEKLDVDTNIVCVAGGTGIAYVLPLLLELARLKPVTDRQVSLIWAIRHSNDVAWVRDELRSLRKVQQHLNLAIHIHVTRDATVTAVEKVLDGSSSDEASSSGEEICNCEKDDVVEKKDIVEKNGALSKSGVIDNDSGETIEQGRPNLKSLVGDFVTNTVSGRTILFASGPGGMITDLRSIVADLSQPSKVWRGKERFDIDLVYDDRLEW